MYEIIILIYKSKNKKEKRILQLNFVAHYFSNLIDDNSENLFQVTEFYEELFDYKFPLNKMDMAAIPDFQVNYYNV